MTAPRHRNIGRNIIANGVGRFSAVLSNIVFVPLYIRLMGGESYGLVVAYATLMASLQVLDAGWSSLLSRQLALRAGRDGGGRAGSAANLARTVEVISWTTGVLIGTVIVLLAPAIADGWLITRALPRDQTILGLRLIGAIIAVQWPSMAYQGAVMGLQEQVKLNAVKIATSFAQALGTALLLWAVSPTVRTYFLGVLLAQSVNTLLMRRLMWAKIARRGEAPPRFDWREIVMSWRFTLGVAGVALLASVLTQADKIVLSRSVPLAEFAIYGVAFTVCGVLTLVSGPVLQAVFPRLTQLSADLDDGPLRNLYFQACELVALIAVPAWTILAFYPRILMSLWMGAGARADATALLLPIIASGTLLNAMMTLPYGLQIATEWTSLSVIKNVMSVAVFFPALLWAVDKHGVVGAAAIWTAINTGYLLFEIPIMHRRVLKGAMPRWYFSAVFVPVGIGAAIGWLSRHTAPAGSNPLVSLLFLALVFTATAATLAAVLPSVRHELCKRLTHRTLAEG